MASIWASIWSRRGQVCSLDLEKGSSPLRRPQRPSSTFPCSPINPLPSPLVLQHHPRLTLEHPTAEQRASNVLEARALEVLDKFSEFGCTLDGDSYYLVIQATGKSSMVGAAWGVCEKMISSRCFADGKKAGEIVTFFCKGKKVTEAHSVYLAAKEKKVQIPMSSLDFLVGALAKNDETISMALELLEEYKGESLKHAGKSFAAEAKKIYRKLSRVTYHILIRGYCKMEEFEKALECLKETKEDGVQPNVDEYNKLIQALCLKAMDWRKAEKLLEEMDGGGLYLKGITRSLIAAVKELEMEEVSKGSQES